MNIKMAVARDNIERCIDVGIYGTNAGRVGLNVKRLCELKIKDKLILYASGISKFAGIVEIIKPFYESNEKIWNDNIYPYRVDIKPIIYLPKDKWLNVKDYVYGLDFFQNKVHYQLHFVNNLMPVNESDYNFIKNEMEKLIAKVN